MTRQDSPSSGVRRRDVLKGAAASAVTAFAGCATSRLDSLADFTAPRSDAGRDRIVTENQHEGSDFQLTKVRLLPPPTKGMIGAYRTPAIEGYCSHQSIRAGETLRVYISTSPAANFTLEVFRMGYYGGAGARLMQTIGPVQGVKQPDPPIGDRRIRECQWTPSVEIKIPDSWTSGVYLGRLTRVTDPDKEHAWQSYVIFIVKDDRPADVLFQCSDNTWQAYNRWPDDYSLYTGPGGSLKAGRDVSFDRPYGKYVQILEHPLSVGSGEFLLWEFPLVYWLEKHGYDVTYCSNSDMLTPERGLKCRSFISVGHDEYWDERQYHSVAALRDAGVNLLFLCGNSVCFVAPFSASSSGQPNRIITRAGRYGGLTEAEKPQMGPFPIDGPNENLLMGARTITPFNGGGDWICAKPDHWIFAGTGMKKGEGIPGLVGWEFHGDPAHLPGLDIVAEGVALAGGTRPTYWKSTVYPGPKGNWVFNASTIWWAQGLSKPPGHILPWSHWTRPHGPDERVQQITANVLRRAITGALA